MTANKKKHTSHTGKRIGTVPLVSPDRRNGSVLFWDLGEGASLSRNIHENDVVLYHRGEVSASFTAAEANSLGHRIYREVKDSDEQNRIRYARALCSAAEF